jgi:putative heme-binding domain-containing protein
VAKFRPSLAGGDPAAGEKLFQEHPVAACMRCHKVYESGGDAGPNLTDFAAKHDRAYILESIVAPNAKIAPGFQMIILTMKDGSVIAGLLKKETKTELAIENPGAPAQIVKTTDIKQRDNAPSGMLPNLGDLLTKREIRDIVEYVASLK